jgi:DNA-binding CsgD family transcriptional regulator
VASTEQTTPIETQIEIVSLYASGLSIGKVAIQLDVDKSTVSTDCHWQNYVPVQNRASLPAVFRAEPRQQLN